MKVLQIFIYKNDTLLDTLYIIDDGKEIVFEDGENYDFCAKMEVKNVSVEVSSLTAEYFLSLIRNSDVIRIKFLNLVLNKRSYLRLNMNLHDEYALDKKGGKIVEILALERREVDHAMAWFSTLGGAFSALGDSDENCAVIAGKISMQQFKLAMRLSDPFLLARCRLYLALSYIQRGFFKTAKEIINAQYAFATKDNYDQKLISMCKGIAAKWKYDRQKFKKRNALIN